ncbi:MAG TPA: hypothetical protein VIF09_19760 [Polyangiaceae bacterium]
MGPEDAETLAATDLEKAPTVADQEHAVVTSARGSLAPSGFGQRYERERTATKLESKRP